MPATARVVLGRSREGLFCKLCWVASQVCVRARKGCRQEDLRLQTEEGRREQREGRKQEGRRKAVMEGGEKEGGKGAREGGRRPVEILA